MSWTDRIVEEPDPKAAKMPLWVHGLLRLGLQIFLGYLTYRWWVREEWLLAAIAGFVFIYAILVLIFGKQIRRAVIDLAGDW